MADTLVQHKAHAGVDDIRLGLAARSHGLGGVSQADGIHVMDVAVRQGGHITHNSGLRQPGYIIAAGGVASLSHNHLPQLLQSPAAVKRVQQPGTAFRHIRGGVRQHQHMRAQLDGHIQQGTGGTAGQHVDSFLYFQRVADMTAQGLAHIGYQRYHAAARVAADAHHGLGQFNAVVQRLHQRARAGFDVQHNALRAAGQLFGYDAGGDQRQAVHRGGYVPQGVQGFIRGSQIFGLADDCQPNILYLLQKGFFADIYAHARDAFQLVQGSAGVAQTAAAHFGYGHAAGGYQGGQN